MSSMKDFRNIADDIMSEIKVGDELKEKTLKRCLEKRSIRLSKFLIPAACFALIIGIVNMNGLWLKPNPGEKTNPEINILLGKDEGPKTLPEGPGDNTIPDTGPRNKRLLKTPEEAKNYFGNAFLMPAYIPKSFRLSEMYADGSRDGAAKVILSYVSGERSFLVIEEKMSFRPEFNNYKTIDIKGANGYLKPDASDNSGSTGILDTEVHWFVNDIHYSVMGLITGNEAVKVAKSMK